MSNGTEELDPDGPAIADLTLGVPGPAEPLPDDDADQDELAAVNDYAEDED